MVKVTAATSFLGNEGMWRAGDTKEVSNDRAHELLAAGFVIEATNQANTDLAAEPSALQQVADAVGATVANPADNLPAVADALGATVAPETELPPVTHDNLMKEDKGKEKTKEEKHGRETKAK